jgi:transposase InsO family protein
MDHKQYALEIHKPFRKPKPTRQVQVKGIDDVWGADLMDMQWMDKDKDFLNANEGYRYISVWIDVFSKYAWAVPLKTKKPSENFEAFRRVVELSGRKPRHIWCDKGSEYYGKEFKKPVEALGIQLYSTYGPHKSVVAERFNQTLGRMLWLKFDELQTRKWLNLLPDILEEYNTRKHRTIGMSPTEASKPVHELELFQHMYMPPLPPIAPRLELGTWVRIARTKGIFEKGSYATWSTEPFQIVGISHGHPPLYYLRDLLGEEILGAFYEAELQQTGDGKRPTIFHVEKVLSRRTINGQNQVLVHWLGLPKKYDSWIDA